MELTFWGMTGGTWINAASVLAGTALLPALLLAPASYLLVTSLLGR